MTQEQQQPKLVLNRKGQSPEPTEQKQQAEQTQQEPKFKLKDLLRLSLKDMKEGSYKYFVIQLSKPLNGNVNMNNDYRDKVSSHIHIVQKESIDDLDSLLNEVDDYLSFYDDDNFAILVTAFGCCTTMKEAQDFITQITNNDAGGVSVLQHIPRIVQLNF